MDKKKVRKDICEVDIDGISIQEAIDKLNTIAKSSPTAFIETEDYYGSVRIKIYTNYIESDEEFELRVKKEKDSKATRIQNLKRQLSILEAKGE